MTSPSPVDVLVVGAGINGLSAAALLAKSGQKVGVVEAQPEPGGAVRTSQVTEPGFHHDLFAMNLGLFAGGPVMAQLGPDLERHGFRLVPTDKPFCSVFPDGSMIGVLADPEATANALAGVAPDDVDAWRDLTSKLGEWAPHIVGVLGSEMPSWALARSLFRTWRALGMDGLYELARLGLQSTRSFTDEHFTDPRTKALVAAWGMHLDFAPDIAGGALFSFLESMGGQIFGMVIGEGGAAGLINALVAIIEENGGYVRCGAEVTEISTSGKRATGVRLQDGTRLAARTAVISNVNPALMPGLLPTDQSQRVEVQRAKAFSPGLATMMIHLALNELPQWTSPDARQFNYVHIGPYIDDMAMTYTQAAAGRLPSSPTLVVGQPTVSDPSRAPQGKHVLWVQVRMLPLALQDGSTWAQRGEEYADLVIDKIEEYAPGLRASILSRCVMTPDDLESHNANLVKGDSLGGSHHPAQFFFLRPVPGWGRHRTPLRNLYVCGSGTWPGGGVGGASGALVAKHLS